MNWKIFFDSLGMNGTVWQWKIRKWQKNFSGQVQGAQNDLRHTTYKHPVCIHCGTLYSASDYRCPECHARKPTWVEIFLRKFFGLIMPFQFQISLLLIILNVIVAVVGIKFFGVSNLFSPNSVSLLRMGAFNPVLFSQGEFWRILTYGYLHIGILHILMNMLTLSQVGPMLEEQIGKRRLFVVYTLCLVGGAVADLIVRGGSAYLVIAGASGAIFGLIGFGISFEHFYGGVVGKQNRDFFFKWALYAFVFGWMVHADNIAHLGGMIAGLVLGPLVYKERRIRPKTDFLWTILTGVCLLATIGSFIAMIQWNLHLS